MRLPGSISRSIEIIVQAKTNMIDKNALLYKLFYPGHLHMNYYGKFYENCILKA